MYVCVTEIYNREFSTFLAKSIATWNSNEKSVQPSNTCDIWKYETSITLHHGISFLLLSLTPSLYFSVLCFVSKIDYWNLNGTKLLEGWDYVLLFWFSLTPWMKLHACLPNFLSSDCAVSQKKKKRKTAFNPIPLYRTSDPLAELTMFFLFVLHSNHWK